MKSNGYKVEFLPLERRMQERRFLESAPSYFGGERRLSERREIDDAESASQLNIDLKIPRALAH